MSDGIWLFELCRDLGIAVVPYCPIGRGFFGGRGVVESLPADDKLVWSFTPTYKKKLSVIAAIRCFLMLPFVQKANDSRNLNVISNPIHALVAYLTQNALVTCGLLAVVLEITSKVHGWKYREEQGVLFSNRKTGCKAWLYSCSACPCLGSQSRGWCCTYPWWVSLFFYLCCSVLQFKLQIFCKCIEFHRLCIANLFLKFP